MRVIIDRFDPRDHRHNLRIDSNRRILRFSYAKRNRTADNSKKQSAPQSDQPFTSYRASHLGPQSLSLH